MSNTITQIDGLSEAVKQELDKMNAEVIENVNNAAKKATTDAVKELKQTSPKRFGKYAKGWTKKLVANRLGVVEYVAYNAKHYRLTHLLEFGHAKQNGGRTRAFPHIAKANENAQNEFIRLVEEMKL